ncbi:unnamed protein product [Blumeria hordei]|uniref:Uncharacterized protein n=1 Tax=Blumeria hordei TaxID=2867405 RepID=A0A383UJ66_BLUHO|nr:unnamed protein product [Blumeria hordei]
MGNDGGSIPRRIELVKEAARKPDTSTLRATLLEAQTHAWTTCPISNHPLAPPIASDCAGTLYNKDAVLEQLLPKPDTTISEDVFQGRVKCLRDVVEVLFTTIGTGKNEKRICPITSKELGPSTRSVYLVPCGHVFSEAAIREVKSDRCLKCNEIYTRDNTINILPNTPEQVDRLAERIQKLRDIDLTHSLKKIPGVKKRRREAVATKTNSLDQTTLKTNGINNAATASLTSKVLIEQEERNKRRRKGMNENLKSLFSVKDHSTIYKKDDFMTRGFSIPTKKI